MLFCWTNKSIIIDEALSMRATTCYCNEQVLTQLLTQLMNLVIKWHKLTDFSQIQVIHILAVLYTPNKAYEICVAYMSGNMINIGHYCTTDVVVYSCIFRDKHIKITLICSL